MGDKTAPLGICDLCGEQFPPGVSPYTSKGKLRRYCSRECQNTANSRAGAAIRSEKMQERVQRGEWQNPAEGLTHEQIVENARKGAAVRARQHREAIEAGTWQNPADAPGAREKLSRPRRHADNPVLHSVFEKFSQGLSMSDLTEEEVETYRRYRRRRYRKRRKQIRAWRRRWYRKRYYGLSNAGAGQNSSGEVAVEGAQTQEPEENREEGRQNEQEKLLARRREQLRETWRRQRECQKARGPNIALRQARARAGYSQARLGELLDVSSSAVGKWERVSTRPNKEMQGRVAEVLGVEVEDIFPAS